MKFIGNKEVPLSDIIPCPLLVEREDLGDIDSMTGDIFTPIIVRPSKEQLDKYERITGLRRFKKAEKDKKNTILCSIYEMTDEEAVLVHAKENLQRKNLNLIEEAREYENMEKRLSEIRGKKVTQEELAKILKKSQEDISNKKRLLKLAKPVQNYLALNKLGMYNALLLLQIKDDNLQTEIAEEAVANNYTTEKLKARIDKLKEELEYDEAVGQYRFRKNGSFYKPSPKVIQQPTKIKLVLQEPYCPRIVELIYEGYKYQRDNSENCPSCPVQDLCAKFVKYFTKYHDLLERKKVKESAQEIKLIPKT
jgi:ParB/RepB/Spo0J family partition protein